MKVIIAWISLFLTLSVVFASAACADEDPEGDGTGGAFSPKFDNSPVTILLCLTENACPVKP